MQKQVVNKKVAKKATKKQSAGVPAGIYAVSGNWIGMGKFLEALKVKATKKEEWGVSTIWGIQGVLDYLGNGYWDFFIAGCEPAVQHSQAGETFTGTWYHWTVADYKEIVSTLAKEKGVELSLHIRGKITGASGEVWDGPDFFLQTSATARRRITKVMEATVMDE
jgi:hypothetical protein